MQTITDEVGSGPIQAITYAVDEIIGSYTDAEAKITNNLWLDSGERIVIPTPHNTNITSGLDGRREKCELNLTGGPAPKGEIVDTFDNGPDFKAATDNDVLARKNTLGDTKRYPLGEMYERGDLGINEIENRRHWFDSQRFKKVHADAKGDSDNSVDDWRELMLEFYEGIFNDVVTSFNVDKGLCLSDDMEFEDSTTPAECEVVDCGGWNQYRDLAPHAHQSYAQQVVALMTDVLGNDYEVLCAAIERGWKSQQIGETEGYTNRASASACGKGMLRSALRNLSRFYVSLDRIEERGERPPDVWPLIGAFGHRSNTPPATTGPAIWRTL
jgi:hypothetical protein